MNCDGESSAGLAAVIQKLEESLLNPDSSIEEKALTVQSDEVDSFNTPVPALIRQIITRNLAEGPSGAAVGEISVQEENRRLKDLLSQARMDKDQLLIKQAALTSRLEQMLTLQLGESDHESVYGAEHQRLREESRAYRFKLQAYQDSQQKQAQLVHKLQAKVLQYKKRSGDLEQQVLEKTSELEKLRLSLQCHLDSSAQQLQRSEQEHSLETQSKLTLLEEERQR
ncbi:rootletin isoform X1 [Tachysurus ichikawai]